MSWEGVVRGGLCVFFFFCFFPDVMLMTGQAWSSFLGGGCGEIAWAGVMDRGRGAT